MSHHLANAFSDDELEAGRMSKPFKFTRGIPVMQLDMLIGVTRPSGPKAEV